ncbi:electron transport complex subunit RsxD [Thiohalobacter sp. IOR34]|uniref:electron transport complex subunit RsxD n=1 Tax=Thiohalobacter sp. IOR34 TaxID=3057176 RepID=UPI0025B1E77F|nr:electron transport complex subunit RsxD [Thiohalobacter sp. IOR34]WJW76052.1 electron transport complex subunit RsxD [Thiohalobacter sp. IOR34]
MQFHTYSSPHIIGPNRVDRLMRQVLLALLPGSLCAWWFFGWGLVFNLAMAGVSCIAAEALMLRLRQRPAGSVLGDGSALLTGVLLGLALPPLAPWWIPVIGSLFAIVVAKQLFGGLGYNPFNPAMVGYVVLIISFPREMTLWPIPAGLDGQGLSFSEAGRWVFAGQLPANLQLDALTSATPLDTIKTRLGLDYTMSEITAAPIFSNLGGRGWEWINLGYLAGGLWLLRRRAIHWQIPAGVLGGLFGIALLFYLFDPDAFPSPLLHLFSGAAMLGAFFIATDPVTASTTARGRLIYGAGIGIIVYVIRTWGGYPDGMAFAVLLMNMAAPTIDHYTRPRVFGEQGRKP